MKSVSIPTSTNRNFGAHEKTTVKMTDLTTGKEALDQARGLVVGANSPLFRFVANFYSERKLAAFMLNYLAIICVVFTHFALTTGNADWEYQMYYLKDATGFTKWFVSRFALLEAGGTYSNNHQSFFVAPSEASTHFIVMFFCYLQVSTPVLP